MEADEINALDPTAFEAMLAAEWAVTRKDIYEQGIGPTPTIAAALPMRPPHVLKRLKISQAILVAVLITGDLARPGNLGKGRVAWRKDEVEKLVPLRER